MAGERRVERVGSAGVRADRLCAEADQRRLLGQPAGALHRNTGRVRPALVRVQELLLASRTSVPPGPVQQPAAVGQRSVLAFPLLDVLDLEQEIRVGRSLRAEVEHNHRGDQPVNGYLRNVVAVPPGRPVNRRVEVGAGVLSCGDVGPVPGRAASGGGVGVLQGERDRVSEGGGQVDDRRVRAQRRGEIDYLDVAKTQPGDQGIEYGHARNLLHAVNETTIYSLPESGPAGKRDGPVVCFLPDLYSSAHGIWSWCGRCGDGWRQRHRR